MTSWVASTPRANSSKAVGTWSPTTVWKEAPTFSARRRSPATAPTGAPARPSPRSTCTANSSADSVRSAMRAARRSTVSLSGPPVSATTTRSRVSQMSVICWSVRYRCRATSTWSASHSSAISRSAVRLRGWK